MRHRIASLAIATLAAVTGLVVLPGSPVQAATIPPLQFSAATLPNLAAPQHALAHPDGGVTLGCSSGSTNGALSFSGAGSSTRTVATTSGTRSLYACAGKTAVASNGTLYTAAWDTSENKEVLLAYSGSTLLWAYTPPCQIIGSVVVGTNDNIYLLVTDGSCGYPKLVGVEPTLDVSETVPDEIANTEIQRSVAYSGALSAYSGGLVVRLLDGIGFYDYTGDRETGAPGWEGLTLGGFDGQPFATADAGWAMVPIIDSSPPVVDCPNDSNAAAGINAYGVGGLIWSHQLPPCSHVVGIRPMYSGGAIVLLDVREQYPNLSGYRYKQYLYAISPTGDGQHEEWKWAIPHAEAGDTLNYMWSVGVDLNGNVAVLRAFRENSDGLPGVEFSLLSGFSGAQIGHFMVEGDTSDGYGFQLSQTDAVPAIANGTVYLPLTECSSFSSCGSNTAKLYAVELPGVYMEYPRGAVLTNGTPWKSYVAMGDSYSSGEGVPAFESGTDTTGPPQNRCHRSSKAYGRLLHDNPALRLHLSAFVACSGAITDYIAGQWPTSGSDVKNTNEDPQEDVLSAGTDVVTISIGGNDVEFPKLAGTCLLADCALYGQDYLDLIDDKADEVGAALDEILGEATNAQVYLVGYPMVIGASGCPQTDANMDLLDGLAALAASSNSAAIATLTALGAWYGLDSVDMGVMLNSGSIEFSNGELAVIYDYVTALGEMLHTVAASKGSRVKYIDPLASGSPFTGHELCTSVPYFNPLVVGTAPAYSFHPNAKGQAAYAQLIAANYP